MSDPHQGKKLRASWTALPSQGGRWILAALLFRVGTEKLHARTLGNGCSRGEREARNRRGKAQTRENRNARVRHGVGLVRARERGYVRRFLGELRAFKKLILPGPLLRQQIPAQAAIGMI